jgi:hypothetical protein
MSQNGDWRAFGAVCRIRRLSPVWLLLTIFSAFASATIVDRIAVVVNQQIITEVQLDEEIRVTALLNRQAIRRDDQTRRAAAARLIQQELVRHEMELSQYPFPTAAQVDTAFAETLKQLGGREAVEKQIASYQLTDAILKEHLQFQLTLVKFIDFRFRPDVDISETDLRVYYERELAKWKTSHTGTPPTFEESRASIEKAISDERVELAMSSWVDEAKRDAAILYLDKGLQ